MKKWNEIVLENNETRGFKKIIEKKGVSYIIAHKIDYLTKANKMNEINKWDDHMYAVLVSGNKDDGDIKIGDKYFHITSSYKTFDQALKAAKGMANTKSGGFDFLQYY